VANISHFLSFALAHFSLTHDLSIDYECPILALSGDPVAHITSGVGRSRLWAYLVFFYSLSVFQPHLKRANIP
jgi:hypothetical protein